MAVQTERALLEPENAPAPALLLQESDNSEAGSLDTRSVFCAVADRQEDLASLLECFYTAHLMKTRHPDTAAVILVHPANVQLARHARVFNEVVPVVNDAPLYKQIRALKPRVLYIPRAEVRHELAGFLSGAKIRIGGGRLRLVSRLLGTQTSKDAEGLGRLKEKGVDLLPDTLDFRLEPFLGALPKGLPHSDFVWISLFDPHDVNAAWPLSHVARLSRMLEKLNLRLVAHVPRDLDRATLQRELTYLKKNAPGVILIDHASPAERAASMIRASLILGPAGPETMLASMLRRPVIVLQDMKYTHCDDEGEPKPSVYIRFADAIEKHIVPAVDDCNRSCPSCAYQSCMEYISPERVFEQLKRTLFPF